MATGMSDMASVRKIATPGRDPELLGLVGDDRLHDRGPCAGSLAWRSGLGRVWYRDSREPSQKSSKYSGSWLMRLSAIIDHTPV